METNGIATEWFERIEAASEQCAEGMRKIAKRIHTANENYVRTLSEYVRVSEEHVGAVGGVVMANAKIMPFGDCDEPHRVGQKRCDECWPGYPRRCENCGGLVHASFQDENFEGNIWLSRRCDRCGTDWL